MSTELNENMSADEIAAYADSLIQEVQQERAAERKSDAEIVADTSSATYDTFADVKSSDESVVDENSDSEAGEKSKPKWLTDKVKAEANAYGLDDTELAEFTSREELDRALRLVDKMALQEGRKAIVEEEKASDRNEKGQFVKREETPKSENSYKVSLDKDRYDDEIVEEFEKMRDHYESRLSALEQHFNEVAVKSEEQEFDSYVDSLGHADLFGKTGKETEKELERRKELLVAVKAQMIGLERLGRPAKLSDQMVSRVANMVFADELVKKKLKQQTQKVAKMSNLRQGGSPVKPIPPPEDGREWADRLYKELESA